MSGSSERLEIGCQMRFSLPSLLRDLNDEITTELERARATLGHPTNLGDASEDVWINLFNRHLPQRYVAVKAHVVDSKGIFSDQIDVVICDRQYSPIVFKLRGTLVVPAESVYAVFEAKQEMSAKHLRYARRKAATVRSMFRTTAVVPTVDGDKSPKSPIPILAGILTLSSTWRPPLGTTMRKHLMAPREEEERLDIGCVADAGLFTYDATAAQYAVVATDKAVTRFLFELIARVQALGTVAMIDVRAYARWIE